MPILGPSSVLDEQARQYALAPPVIRIWSAVGGVLERVMAFDAARNEPRCSPPIWEPVVDAEPTITGNGQLRTHLAGTARFRFEMTFTVLHPSFSPASAAAPPVSGITELDIRELLMAQMNGKAIELRPHADTAGETQDSRYLVYLEISAGVREYSSRTSYSLRATGIYPTGNVPIEI